MKIALLLSILAMGGCQEQLPEYQEPEILLTAFISVEPILNAGDLLEGGGMFGLDVLNVSVEDEVKDYVLFAPYEVKADVTVSLEKTPSRNIRLSSKAVFDSDLAPRRAVRIELPFPMRDKEGKPWNFDEPDVKEHRLVFQGKASIPQLELTLFTKPRTCSVIYP